MSAVAAVFWAEGRWYALLPLVIVVVGVLLMLYMVLPRAPLAIDVSPDAVTVRWWGRSRTVAISDISSFRFFLPVKEAGRPDHERFFEADIVRLGVKRLFVGTVCESAVAEITRRLPHSKVTITVLGMRGGFTMHVKEIPGSDAPRPPSQPF